MSTEAEELHRIISASVRDMLDAYRLQTQAGPVTDNLQWVQHQLGHATIGQTMDTYAHCVPEAHEHAVESLDQSWWEAGHYERSRHHRLVRQRGGHLQRRAAASEAQVWLYEQTGQKGKLDTNFKTAKDYATQALKAGFKVNDDELPRSEP